MNHLTDEQFEDIMQGEVSPPAHLNRCKDCREHLAEKQAMAEKLRLAFRSVQAGTALADRIRSQLNLTAAVPQIAEPAERAWLPRLHRRLWSGLAAAAILLVILIPVGLYLTTTSKASAAQEELVKIHQRNLEPHSEFYNSADPEKLAQYFKDKLGFTPAFPCIGQGMSIRGCCVAHFRGRIAGSYVVDTPQGVISVIIVTDTPQSIGMTRMSEQTDHGHTFWSSSFARCNMVTVRLGGYSYCAVGEVSHQVLAQLLSRLLP